MASIWGYQYRVSLPRRGCFGNEIMCVSEQETDDTTSLDSGTWHCPIFLHHIMVDLRLLSEAQVYNY